MNPSWLPLGGLFPTLLYHPALAGTPPEEGNWNHLGGLFQALLYHLHPCRRVSMQARARRMKNAISTLLQNQ